MAGTWCSIGARPELTRTSVGLLAVGGGTGPGVARVSRPVAVGSAA